MSDESFKTQWNSFSCYCHDIFESRFEKASEGEKFRKKLFAIKDNEERIRILLNDPGFSELIAHEVDQLLEEMPKREEEKDAKTLIDSIIVDGNYYRMIDQYSKAISLLLNDTSNVENRQMMADCLSKRCELLFLLKHYDECLEDITEMQHYVATAEEFPMLVYVAEKCIKMKEELHLKESVKVGEIKVKCESTILESGHKNMEMVYDEVKGRTMRATKFFKDKSIVAAEEAFVSWLRPNCYDEYCNECLIALNYRSIYCTECFTVKYCSVECREKAWNKYHSVECDFLEVLQSLSMGHIALRIMIMGGVEKAIDLAKVDEIPLTKWPDIGFRSDYASIRSLTGEDCLIDVYFSASLIGSAFMTTLATRMNLIDENSEDLCLFGAIIFKHYAQVYLNTYTIYDQQLKYTNFRGIYTTIDRRLKIGVGLYSTSSLFSHSCDNNVFKYYCGNKIVLVTGRPVAAGKELTVNYGTCASQNTIADRQQFLTANFNFNCQCTACKNGQECVAYAYFCEKCNGPLVVNEDCTNNCVSCDTINADLTEMQKRIDEAKNLVNVGDAHFEDGQVVKAKRCYYQALALYKGLCYSTNRLHFLYNSLAQCYVFYQDFHKAYRCKTHTIGAVKELYGDDTIDVVHSYIECAELLQKWADTSFIKKSSKRKKAQHYSEKAYKLFSRIAEQEFSILSESKSKVLNAIVPSAIISQSTFNQN